MEYIKKEELIIGEIYKADNGSLTYIMKATKDLENVKNIPEYCEFMKHGCFNSSHLTFTNATSEEKHWLNTCIKLNKFITFEETMKTFIPEYVECVEEKVIEPLPQFKVIESIETITKVENNEGNQFFIGDEVIGSKTKIKYKIISFKYNVDKTAILAITDKTPNIGIGINHLEHYIEPKVEETLLEKAKRLYPVGTKFINPNGNRECVIKEKGNYFEGNNHNIYHSIANGVFKYEEGLSGCIYINNTWSKIIE